MPLPDYTTWNVGVGLTWSVFTVDVRYYDTNLSEGVCNVLTSDFTATFNPGNISAINPGGFGSKWCGQTYRHLSQGRPDLRQQHHQVSQAHRLCFKRRLLAKPPFSFRRVPLQPGVGSTAGASASSRTR